MKNNAAIAQLLFLMVNRFLVFALTLALMSCSAPNRVSQRQCGDNCDRSFWSCRAEAQSPEAHRGCEERRDECRGQCVALGPDCLFFP